jgi:signal transduction histidine kinase
MSHELRTRSNAIIGYSEMLMEDAADRGDDASQADLRKIETAGKHLLGLINDILDLSKIEAGRVEIYLEPVEVGKLVAEIRTMFEPLMAKNGNVLRLPARPRSAS